MIIAGRFSFKFGEKVIEERYRHLLEEIEQIIGSVDASKHVTKKSKEKTMRGKMLYSPESLNRAFSKIFLARGWRKVRIRCEYSTEFYVNDHHAEGLAKGAFREMDFVKDSLGVELQLGKYAFMVYNVCAKMTIFSKLGHIGAGVEIVPIKSFADNMSTGVSYFEQLIWDLQARGVADIDIPVLILGIASD
jgi:hypothetical protein